MSELMPSSRRRNSPRGINLAERVAQDIVADIARSRLSPGDRLPSEAIMAQEYGIARSTLREGLRILQTYGIIKIKSGPSGGPELLKVGPNDFGRMASLYFHSTGVTFRQLLEARCIFEPMMAELAAKNRPEDGLARLRENIAQEVDPSTYDGWVPPVAESSQDFHSIVAEMAGNQFLTLITASLHGIFEIYANDPFTKESLAVMNKVHERIAAAIEKGSPDEARRLMARHMRASTEEFERRHADMVDTTVPWLSL